MSLFSSLPPLGRHNAGGKEERKAPSSTLQAFEEAPAGSLVVHAMQGEGNPSNPESQGDSLLSAMAKIAAHIGTPKKFSKASKLALQLLEAGSVNGENAGRFFEILERAMETPGSANEPALRGDYHALFSAVEERKNIFSELQQAKLEVWLLRAVLANDLYTDDTFQFSRATTKVKQALEALPLYIDGEDATIARDSEAARPGDSTAASAPLESSAASPAGPDAREALDEPGVSRAEEGTSERAGKRQRQSRDADIEREEDPFGLEEMLPSRADIESDPFGLDEIIPDKTRRKEEKAKRKREEEERSVREEAQARELLAGRRAAVLECLKAAYVQYKYTWAKTTVEILMKLAFDNIARFTPSQQAEVDSMWTTVRNEQVRRKQGKAGTHKLGKQEETSFERVASKWKGEKMSIRSSVGATGDGSNVTWLG